MNAVADQVFLWHLPVIHRCSWQLLVEGLLTIDGMVSNTVVEGLMTHDWFLEYLEFDMVSRLSLTVTSFIISVLILHLIDAAFISIPRCPQCFRDGQCTHTSWRRYFGTIRAIWCTFFSIVSCHSCS